MCIIRRSFLRHIHFFSLSLSLCTSENFMLLMLDVTNRVVKSDLLPIKMSIIYRYLKYFNIYIFIDFKSSANAKNVFL